MNTITTLQADWKINLGHVNTYSIWLQVGVSFVAGPENKTNASCIATSIYLGSLHSG